MSLSRMRTRILVGVGAWSLGAAVATGISLRAVSMLGQGIIGDAGQQQLTSEAVNRALASEAAEPAATARPSPTASGSGSSARSTRRAQASPSLQPAGGTLLTSQGGTVVAACSGAGVYLVSWSPQQGYEVSNVIRGPAATGQVVFWSGNVSVIMTVSCDGGTPTAATTTHVHDSGDN